MPVQGEAQTTKGAQGKWGAVGWGLWVPFVLILGWRFVLGRQFQVDEFQNLTNISYLAALRTESWATTAAPWQIWLGVLLRPWDDTASMALTVRVFFGVILAVNLLLITWAQPYFRSARGILAVLWIATLTDIFWRYGFEIRHDVLLLTGQLVLFGLSYRVLGGRRPFAYFVLAGWIGGLMVSFTAKGALHAVLYLSLLLLAVNPQQLRKPWRGRLVPFVGILAGLAVATVLVAVTLWTAGALDQYLAWFSNPSALLGDRKTFTALKWLHRPPPLTILFSFVGMYFGLRDLVAHRGQELTRSILTSLFVLVAMAVLACNPTPFPYNFLLLVAPLLLAA
ncbi:MAG: hypothetical protein KC416_11345, partial [Myxococcales bacterium]|nr:hypothetical protein [Myxococcales bacterium]